MKIKIHYFASLREKIGRASDDIESADPLTVMQAWQQATGLSEMLDNLLIAVNQEYASADTSLSDGDELAFFPPVTGG
jgi:molybdopterin synthase sulfur carrier subunit